MKWRDQESDWISNLQVLGIKDESHTTGFHEDTDDDDDGKDDDKNDNTEATAIHITYNS